MSVQFQLLSVDTLDSSTCVVVSTETQRFIFNVGEGTQRLCVEHKVKLGKVAGIFLTSLHPSCIFGLPGFLLTTADCGGRKVCIYGPNNTMNFLRSTKHFMKIPDHVHVAKVADSHCLIYNESKEIVIYMIPHCSEMGICHHSNASYILETPFQYGKFDVGKAESLSIPKGPLYGQLKNGKSIVLDDGRVIEPSSVLGKSEESRYFAVVAALEPPISEIMQQSIIDSEFFKRFQHGGDLENRMDYLIHLTPRDRCLPQYQAWMARFGCKTRHIMAGSGYCVLDSSFIATTRYTNKLNRLCPALFPKLTHHYTLPIVDKDISVRPDSDSASLVSGSTYDVDGASVIGARALSRFHITPFHKQKNNSLFGEAPAAFDISGDIVKFYDQLQVTSPMFSAQQHIVLKERARFDAAMAQLQDVASSEMDMNRWKIDTTTTTAADDDWSNCASLFYAAKNRLTFLGTGCSIPSKYRNVSGICLDFANSNCSVLIDAGEGTWHQMCREAVSRRLLLVSPKNDIEAAITVTTSFGAFQEGQLSSEDFAVIFEEESLRLAQKLKMIWLSHPHADHHLGIVTIITERKRLLLKHEKFASSSVGVGVSCGGSSSIGADETSLTKVLFDDPLLVIAPASLLAFLREYSQHVDSYISDAYTPVSCRQFDPYDTCEFGDVYWNAGRINVPLVAPSTAAVSAFASASSYEKDVDVSSLIGQQEPLLPLSSVLRQTSPVAAALSTNNVLVDDDNSDKIRQNPAVVSNHDVVAEGLISVSSSHKRPHVFFTKFRVSASELQIARDNMRICTDVMAKVGISKIENVQVIHCNQSYGLAIECGGMMACDGSGIIGTDTSTRYDPASCFKVVYSGDTRPCPRLIAMGRNATVLIHEATFEDDKMDEAVSKNHCTIGEALAVGKQMGAVRTILTHFSQRYPSVPPLKPAAGGVGGEVMVGSSARRVGSHTARSDDHVDTIPSTSSTGAGSSSAADSLATVPTRENCSGTALLAFDFMSVSFGDLIWAPVITPLLAEAFPVATAANQIEDDSDYEDFVEIDKAMRFQNNNNSGDSAHSKKDGSKTSKNSKISSSSTSSLSSSRSGTGAGSVIANKDDAGMQDLSAATCAVCSCGKHGSSNLLENSAMAVVVCGIISHNKKPAKRKATADLEL